MNLALSLLIGLVMLAGGARPFATASEYAGRGVARDGGPTSTGAAHLANPAAFAPLVPKGLPVGAILFLSGLVELAIGVLALVPRTRPSAKRETARRSL
jgi:hypothetical protein